MFFLTQNIYDLDILILKDVIKRDVSKLHSSLNSSIEDLNEIEECIKDNLEMIPVGSIQFVEKFLYRFHGIKQMNPIEVPKCLRTEEFLKREYNILKGKDLPKSGLFFVKDVSRLKNDLRIEDIAYLNIKEDSIYQISEVVKILSEYRCYFVNGELTSICNYDGLPDILPDVNLIKKANIIYSLEKDYPKSYTMDVMVTKNGTSIIEIHPFTSVGLYTTLWGNELLYAYKDGIDYYVKYNTKIMEDN